MQDLLRKISGVTTGPPTSDADAVVAEADADVVVTDVKTHNPLNSILALSRFIALL